MRYRLPLALSLCAVSAMVPPAMATTPGVCFSLRDVPAGDALNLRAAPDAKARIVASYPSGSYVIIAKAGRCAKWCRVSASDGNGTKWGWMHSRYLRKQECP